VNIGDLVMLDPSVAKNEEDKHFLESWDIQPHKLYEVERFDGAKPFDENYRYLYVIGNKHVLNCDRFMVVTPARDKPIPDLGYSTVHDNAVAYDFLFGSKL
jgi:hypothetical protein